MLSWMSKDGKILLLSRVTRGIGYGFLSVVLAIYLKFLGFDEVNMRLRLAERRLLLVLCEVRCVPRANLPHILRSGSAHRTLIPCFREASKKNGACEDDG